MTFDSLGRYTTAMKAWDHVGNMIPVVEASEGQRPHGEFKPAAWLPVQFYDKHFEDWFVITPGKLLAFDNDGRLVPAQYGLAGATLTYGTDDVSAGVIDIRTGVALLSAATGTFNVGTVSGFMGKSGLVVDISKPVGVAPYAFWQWGGDAGEFDDGFNPAGFRRHNYNLQHQVAILCDYVLELPLVPASHAAEALAYSSYASNVVTFGDVDHLPVAKNTVRTPMAFTNFGLSNAATTFVNEVDALADIAVLGDWYIDLRTGVISCYAASDPGGGNHYYVSYYNYATAPTTVSKFACAVGALQAGDFVKCDSNSNYTVATSEDFKDIMGQVLEVENVYDKDALGRVRTGYTSLATSAAGSLPAYAGQMDQMPGSATGGVSDKVHYAGAANLVVRINLVSR